MSRRTRYLPAPLGTLTAVVSVACAAVALLLAVSGEAEATFPGKNRKIAFVSTRDTKTESGDIYTMNPSGTTTPSSASASPSPQTRRARRSSALSTVHPTVNVKRPLELVITFN